MRGILLCCCVLVLLSIRMKGQGMYSESEVIFSTDKGVAVHDTSALFTIKDIFINGNTRTKNSIILRELPFAANNAYPLSQIVSNFYDARQRLMNTGLFRNVVVALKSIQEDQVYVQIDVEEKWYLYPLPFVKVVDDKFSRWWNERGRDLGQLNYGVRITQENATGRNDKMHFYVMNGYTKQLMLEYKGLYLDKDLKWYTNLSFAYGKNREINYTTENNKLVPLKSREGFIRTFSHAALDLVYRPAIKTRHTISVGYYVDRVADTVYKLNNNFSDGAMQRVPAVGYNIAFTDVDFIPYPTKGVLGEVGVTRFGFTPGSNMWQFSAKGNLSIPSGEKSFFNLRAVGMIKLPFRQPYSRQQFLGSNDMFLQGYEDYVVEGVAGGYGKAAFVYNLVNTTVKLPKTIITDKFRLFNPVPLRIYAKAFTNLGYIYNPNDAAPTNDLGNRMLYSGGFGLDIVAFADLVFKIEWSLNQLGQNGLYLHQRERF